MTKTSILIVEDERIVAKDLQETLQELGYDAFAIARSSEEALQVATERCPDLVLMDIRIKGPLDGIETATILRERFGVPVVYLTAHADGATLERAKVTEPYGYLIKPIKPDELRSAIEISIFRHDLNRRLRERERWYSTTLRSIADAVVAVDLAGKITFMNPVAELLTGVSAADALGRPAREIVRIGTPPYPVSPLDAALEGRKTVVVEVAQLENATSGGRTIADTAAPVEDGKDLLGAVMVFRDVTEQRLLQKKAELADRLASLGTMAAGVAHEINNPLASISANAGYLIEEIETLAKVDTNLAATLREPLEALVDVEAAARRIARIVESLSVFSRAGDDVPIGEADVHRVVDAAVRSVRAGLLGRAEVRVSIGSLPRVGISEERLEKVVTNLLANAAASIDAGDADKNFISIDARAGDRQVVIEFRDTGRGMPSEVARRIFEPFYTTKSVGGGIGLGLSVCHGIVTSAGGGIEVESETGEGTKVRIRLPIVERDRDSAARDAEPPTARARILIVGGDPVMTQTIKRILREHEVSGASDVAEAVRSLSSGDRFDLILADTAGQVVSGRAFYEALLEKQPATAHAVVFLDGAVAGDDDDVFFGSVQNEKLAKPFSMDGLRELVARRMAPR